MIDEAWLRQLVRSLLDEVYLREFPGFSLEQIRAGLTVPVLGEGRTQ